MQFDVVELNGLGKPNVLSVYQLTPNANYELKMRGKSFRFDTWSDYSNILYIKAPPKLTSAKSLILGLKGSGVSSILAWLKNKKKPENILQVYIFCQ